jgi:hypothetical protein
MKCAPDCVPKRLTAAVIAYRSAAQNGQSSPPMYSSSGFPPAMWGGCPVVVFNTVAHYTASVTLACPDTGGCQLRGGHHQPGVGKAGHLPGCVARADLLRVHGRRELALGVAG